MLLAALVQLVGRGLARALRALACCGGRGVPGLARSPIKP